MVENKIPKSKKHFSEVLGNSSPNTIFLKPVEIEEVFCMILKLTPSNACVPNSIPSNLFKTRSDSLSEPLNEILNMSLTEGIFPDLLKDKKKDKDKWENYRPISLLSNASKLFERAMHTRLYDFIENSGKCYEKQFGLVFANSTRLIMIFCL